MVFSAFSFLSPPSRASRHLSGRYKSREYRSRAVREPRKLLQEFGTLVPKEVAVVVHDSTADCRYLVLPQRPKGLRRGC